MSTSAFSRAGFSCKRTSTNAIRVLPLAAAVAFSLIGSARAADIVVDDPSTGSVAGACTIVDAVTALNTQASVPGSTCAAGTTNDVIDLTGLPTPTTITFTTLSGQSYALMLTRPATIRGALDDSGAPLVTIERSIVSGTPDFGLISSTAALTIEGLQLQNGSAQIGYMGGAIAAGDALTVDDSIITDNTATSAGGGIAGAGSVTLNRTTVSGNSATNAGGGIYSSMWVQLNYSIVSSNSTTSSSGGGGGGVYAGGNVYATRTTVSGNSSAGRGGGVYAALGAISLVDSTITMNSAQSGSGGGVSAHSMGITATGSTIDTNTASAEGGGIYGGDTLLTNSTITGNTSTGGGGGIYAKNFTSSYSTIFDNQSTAGIGGGLDFTGTATANGTIFYGDTPEDFSSPGSTAMSGSFDLVGVGVGGVPNGTLSCDPMLGTLDNYGGPTDTLPLGTGSCAINAASSTPTQSTDQRGYLRPAPGGITPKADIGAYEANSVPDEIFADGFE